MENVESQNDNFMVGNLFRELFDKLNTLESKKHVYKEFDNLTLIEINTIMVIGINEATSMSQIAKTLGVSFGTPTVTIDRLISKGLVVRKRDVEDRRQVFVKLSHEGERVYTAIEKIKNEVTEKLFGILDDVEITTLLNILNKLNSKFDDLFF